MKEAAELSFTLVWCGLTAESMTPVVECGVEALVDVTRIFQGDHWFSNVAVSDFSAGIRFDFIDKYPLFSFIAK